MERNAFRLGTSTFIVGPWPTPDDIATMARAPIATVEVAAPRNWPAVPEEAVRDTLSALCDTRLERWSLHSAFGGWRDISSTDEAVRGKALDSLRTDMALAGELQCQIVVVHPSVEPILAQDRPARLVQARRSLAEVARMAGEFGVRAGVEPLPRTCLGNTADEMALLLEGLPAQHVGICLDVNHANVGQDLVAFIKRFGRRIISLHISDNDGIDEKHWLPGEGVIDWPAVINALRAVGYDGPWMCEVGLGTCSLADRLEQLADNRRQLFARADEAASS
jgi:sugar phosphate isomerase/epimerase